MGTVSLVTMTNPSRRAYLDGRTLEARTRGQHPSNDGARRRSLPRVRSVKGCWAVLLLAGAACSDERQVDDFDDSPEAAATSIVARSITPTSDALALARALLKGKAIVVTNATYEGASSASGTYTDGPLGLKGGVLLTTGKATDAAEPNLRGNTSTDHKRGGSQRCDALSNGAKTGDAAKLTITFDLAPGFDGISILSMFGTEEFPEYVGSRYNDVYGAYLNGQQVIFDASGAPITIHGPFFASSNVVKSPTNQTGYDGATGVLKTQAKLPGGSKHNVLELVVCDGGDRVYDSGAFLAELAGCEGETCTGTRLCESVDEDGDGSNACVDCNDKEASTGPSAVETPDGKDNNCDGQIDEGTCAVVDADGDGSNACVDCNDHDATVSPAKVEVADGKDNNCNGVVDEGVSCSYSAGAVKQYAFYQRTIATLSDFTVADINKDGLADVVVNENRVATVFLGQRSGTLVISSYFHSALNRIVLGDANGDGRIDALYPTDSTRKSVAVHLGNGAGGFSETPTKTYAVNQMFDGAFLDIDGDGVDDLVHGGNGAGFLKGSDGALGLPKVLPLGVFSGSVLSADVNRDGIADAVLNSYGPQVFLGAPSGPTYFGQSNPSWETSDGALVDVNGDGHVDFAAGMQAREMLAFYRGDSTGRFAYSNSFALGRSVSGVAVRDLNRDGKADVVVAGGPTWGETLRLHMNTSRADEALFGPAVTTSLPSRSYSKVAVADVNGDGVEDILLMNDETDRQISLLLGSCN